MAERAEDAQQKQGGAEEKESQVLPSFALSAGLFYVHVSSCTMPPEAGQTKNNESSENEEQHKPLELQTSAGTNPSYLPPHAPAPSPSGSGAGYRQAYCVLSVGRQQVRTDNVPINFVSNNDTAEWMFATTFDVISSQAQEFNISVWISAPSQEPPLQLVGTWSIDLKNIRPSIFEERNIVLQRPVAAGATAAQFTPTLRLQTQLTKHQSHVTEDDFEKLRLIGRGSFGKVFQVRKRDTGKVYAMKVLSKGHVIKSNAVKHTMAENRVLKNMAHPFIVNLNYAFQTATHLYMVIDYFNGGELFHHLTQEDYFAEERARFYAAQVVSALSYLHSRQVIYRDLKPENILLDMEGNICLVDFGLCKEGIGLEGRTFTFCGSPEYLAPELLLGKGYGKEVDWWALGTLIYEMLSGLPPFWDEDEEIMHRKILSSPLKLPQYMSASVKDLLKNLLQREPSQRLGSGEKGSEHVKMHPWFRTVDWAKLEKRELIPPFRPHITSLFDMRYFDSALTQEHPNLSVSASNRGDIDQNAFVGFSYDVDHDLASSFLRKSRTGTPSSPQTSRRRARRRLSTSSNDSNDASSLSQSPQVRNPRTSSGGTLQDSATSGVDSDSIFPLE